MIVDPENNIWIAEIPVRCDTQGHLVLCNEEIIGSVQPDGPGHFIAHDVRRKVLDGYPTIEAATRAVTLNALGDAWGLPFEDKDINDYIATGAWG